MDATETHLVAHWSYESGQDTIRLLDFSTGNIEVPLEITTGTVNLKMAQGPILCFNNLFWAEDSQLRYLSAIDIQGSQVTDIDRMQPVARLLRSDQALFTPERFDNVLKIYKWPGFAELPADLIPTDLGAVPSMNRFLTARTSTATHVIWGAVENTGNDGAAVDVFLSTTGESWSLSRSQLPTPVTQNPEPFVSAIAAGENTMYLSMDYPNEHYLLMHSLLAETSGEPAKVLYHSVTAYAEIRSLVIDGGHIYFSTKLGENMASENNIVRLEIPPL